MKIEKEIGLILSALKENKIGYDDSLRFILKIIKNGRFYNDYSFSLGLFIGGILIGIIIKIFI